LLAITPEIAYFTWMSTAPVQPQQSMLDAYFDKYAESHRNPTNKLIHWICVPLIVFSILGLVWALPFPRFDILGKMNGYINWATFLILFAMVYYLRLSVPLAAVMLLVLSAFAAGIVALEKGHDQGGWLPMWQVCGIIFALAWAGQFIGHKIEGKKPSFLDDVRFLLIGPIWLLHFLFKKAAIRY
jgi:uncharacterized membrane protein YGL010W